MKQKYIFILSSNNLTLLHISLQLNSVIFDLSIIALINTKIQIEASDGFIFCLWASITL